MMITVTATVLAPLTLGVSSASLHSVQLSVTAAVQVPTAMQSASVVRELSEHVASAGAL
jgi:hypothetical protein